jgi:hypothetical protein
VSANTLDTSWFLTLDEGLASGEVQVREQGSDVMVRNRGRVIQPTFSAGASVNQLVLINRSKRPLLLLAGELVSGGKQDRIIGKDRLVPAGSEPLPLDVFCVEHGGLRERTSRTRRPLSPSVREQGDTQKGSGRWGAVRAGTTAKPNEESVGRTGLLSAAAGFGADCQDDSE